MTQRLLIIRHGETTWNAIRRMQGQANSPLSEQGIGQAKALKDVLAGRDFASVTSSDLDRTIDTAFYAGFPEGRRLEIWREIHVGDWSGRLHSELEELYPDDLKRWKLAEFTPPNAESWEVFVARIKTAIDGIRTLGPGTHLVFSHGLVVKAAYCLITGAHHTEVPVIKNCSLSEFDLSASGDSLVSFNEALHTDALANAV